MCHIPQMSLKAAILGFLSLEPTSGYVLKQRFEGSVRSFWTVTQSQIYRELHALQSEGLAVAQREAGDGRPDSMRYRLTANGERALEAWLNAPVDPIQLRHPLLLKFVFSATVDQERLDAVLSEYAQSLARSRAELEARLDAREVFALARSRREADIWRLSIEHGLAWCDAELKWIASARERLGPAKRGHAKPSPAKPSPAKPSPAKPSPVRSSKKQSLRKAKGAQ
jgi:PadR family transcriptional regulator, regulatory protein AphA